MCLLPVLLAAAAALAVSASPLLASPSITITRTSGSILYTHPSTAVTDGYVSYQVTNGGSAIGDAWAKIDGLGSITLATNEDGLYHIGAFASGATKPVFFYLKATGAVAAETHTVHVYSGKPGSGGTEVGSQSFSLSAVTDLEASANKVTGGSVSPSSGLELGGEVVVTVDGDTGQVQSSGPPIILFSPAASESWPADTFQLESTSIVLTGTSNHSYSNTLLVPSTDISSGDSYTYVATYTYRAENTTSSSTSVSPTAHISSGSTNLKHTSISSWSQIPAVSPVTNTLTLSDSASPSSLSAAGTTTYTVTIANSGNDPVTYDDVVETLPSGVSYTGGSASYNGGSIADPSTSGQTLTWTQAFGVPANGSSTLTFDASVPGTNGTYTDSVVGHANGIQLDTTLSTSDDSPAHTTVTVAPAGSPPTATITSHPADPSSSSSATFQFTSSNPSATFQCSLDSGAYAACTSAKSYSGLADGSHTFRVKATDGNGTGAPDTYTWTIGTSTPPGVPTATITSGPSDPSGSSDASFSFTADDPSATFQCSLDGAAYAACTSPAGYTGLADGPHTFDVEAANDSGTGPAAEQSWTIDTSGPAATIDSHPDDPSNDPDPTFSFSSDSPGATLLCSIDGSAYSPCLSPVAVGPLADGEHTFCVEAQDSLGNTGAPACYTWTVDTTPPDVSIDSHPDDPSTSSSASFGFSSTDPTATFLCSIDGGAYAPCTSPDTIGPLADEEHTFSVEAVDPTGNTSEPATYTWTIDTTPPTASITSHPDSLTQSTSATFAFTADKAASFKCSLDGGPFADCTSGIEFSGLADGSHTFEVEATNGAGTGPAASNTWTVDTTPPDVSIDSHPDDPSASSSASFGFSSGDPSATFLCSVDGGDYAPCWSPASFGPLADGSHTFSVEAVDPAGNTSQPASYSWTIDTTAPDVSITSHPSDPSASSSAELEFSSNDETASLTCKLDGAAYAGCASPTGYSGLADGQHTFTVEATDPAGNSATDSYTWTVDTTAPDVSITTHPDDPSASSTGDFTFATGDPTAALTCKLDSGDFASCSSPAHYTGLADGQHTFTVKATDPAGNSATDSYAWTVDTTAPEVWITSHPADPSSSSSADLGFTTNDAGAAKTCKLDSGDFASCSSPAHYTGLADGQHTFTVKATDPAGNSATDSYTWTVDTTAPDVWITSDPSNPSSSSSAAFTFASHDQDASFRCRMDGSGYGACPDPKSYSSLVDGQHSFWVEAVDPAGNVSAPASYTWMIDTTAPTVTIVKKPTDPTRWTSALFTFASNDAAAAYRCRLDGGAYGSCTPPLSYDKLADGRHTFQVTATDELGNTSGPATYSWTIDTTPPDIVITEHPLGHHSTATFAFESTDPAALFKCKLDGGSFQSCRSPKRYTDLKSGRHTFTVFAYDAAANQSKPASYSWNVK